MRFKRRNYAKRLRKTKKLLRAGRRRNRYKFGEALRAMSASSIPNMIRSFQKIKPLEMPTFRMTQYKD